MASTSIEGGAKRMIILKSSDGELFEVDEAVAMESQIIKHMIEDDCTENGIPLPNVTSKILSKVIEYCKCHVESVAEGAAEDNTVDEDLKLWDADFVKVDQATLCDLILAANYLNIKSLLDLTCQTVADMIKGKTRKEIAKSFNIKNDFTPEEEEEFRREEEMEEEEIHMYYQRDFNTMNDFIWVNEEEYYQWLFDIENREEEEQVPWQIFF